MLYQIKSLYFTAGIIAEKAKSERFIVFEAAPIVKYMKGWDLGRVIEYCKNKKWTLTEVEITKLKIESETK